MKLAFFVNRVETEIPEYLTNRLALCAARSGHDVWFVGAGDVDYEGDENLSALAYPGVAQSQDSLEKFLERAQQEDGRSRIDLAELDAFMLRNDSIEDLHERPWATRLGTVFGTMLASREVTVVNDPVSLSRASSKLYLQEFPREIRPACLVSHNHDGLKSFIERMGRAMLKPLYGTKGRHVFLAAHEDANLNQMIEAVLEDGYVIAQEYVEGAEQGDTRLFLLEGKPLKSGDVYAAFRRVPSDDDIRSNIMTGGSSAPAEIGERELAIAGALEERLVADGMFFVGIDIVGDKVVEINAESAGGFQSTEHYTGVDFSPLVIDALERKVAGKEA